MPKQRQTGRNEGPSRHRVKGKARAAPQQMLQAGDLAEEEHRGELLESLEREDVGLEVARDALENDSAVIIIRQLMSTIEDLRREAERANSARKDAENQLVAARKKRPTSPRSPPQEKHPRKIRGQGIGTTDFSSMRMGDREESLLGTMTQPTEQRPSSTATSSFGQSSAQQSRASSRTRQLLQVGLSGPIAGPSTVQQQVDASIFRQRQEAEIRDHPVPSRYVETRGRRQPSPPNEPALPPQGNQGRGWSNPRGRGGKPRRETLPPPVPAPAGNPHLAEAVVMPWPVVPIEESKILKDDPPRAPAAPLSSDNDDGASDGNSGPSLEEQLDPTDEERHRDELPGQ